MSDAVTLTLRAPLTKRLDLEGVLPERTAGLSGGEIAALTIGHGGERRALGDVFGVWGERAAYLRIDGDLSLASRVGAGMTAGRLDVHGNVGDDAGMAMGGGVLHVSGNAGERFCAAAPGASKGMTGGEAIVLGSTGGGAGTRCRRGLIVIGGDSGSGAARDIIAGTLLVCGTTGADAGHGSKRGSIVALGHIDVLPTYRYACTYEPAFVRLLLTYLRRTYRMGIADEAVSAAYRRYCGDAGEPGKGEILQRVL